MKDKIFVAGYIRVSTAEQSQTGFGLDVQQKTIEDYCQKQKYNLTKIYADKGVSGGILERKGLKELLKDAKQNKFQKVIVAKLDRVARDMYYSLWIEKELLKSNVDLFSVAEPYSKDDFMLDGLRKIVMVFAEIEKKMIASRLTNGRHEKTKNGGWSGGINFGYDAIEGKLIVNEKEAEVIKNIFRLKYQKRKSYSDIARWLNQSEIATKMGKKWWPCSVRNIIKSPVIRGRVRLLDKQYPGIHQKIIN